MESLFRVARTAVDKVLSSPDGGDELIVLPVTCPPIPGEQDDDGLRAVAAIDVLRHLIDYYEEEEEV